MQDTSQVQELTADQIIQILQENPDVLAAAKTEIVNQLRDRGYNVSDQDITDDRLFGQIRSDDRVRKFASDELIRRGFRPPAEEDEQGAQNQSLEQPLVLPNAGQSTQPNARQGAGTTGTPG